MDFVNGNSRDQMFMASMDQLIEKEAFVRIIDAFVDAIDIPSFQFSNAKLNKTGRPSFHPSIFLKLYLYGYHNGIRSCRKLEKATKVNLEVIWHINGLRNPDYYRLRQQIIEHQFGSLKRQKGFTYTLMKGKDKVLGEVSIMFTAYNLQRAISVLGFQEMMSRKKRKIFVIFEYFILWQTTVLSRRYFPYFYARC